MGIPLEEYTHCLLFDEDQANTAGEGHYVKYMMKKFVNA